MNAITKTAAMPVSMDSKEIAKLLEKDHGNVLRDMRVMLISLYADDYLDAHMPPNYAGGRNAFIQANADAIFRAVFEDDSELNHPVGVTWKRDTRGYLTRITFDKRHTIALIAGYDPKLRLRIVDRLEELEKKLAAPTASFYSLGKSDTLTGAQQEELRAILHSGAEQLPVSKRGAFLAKGWSKLKAHFKVPYREIPRHEFTEALSIAGRHVAEVDTTHAALPAPTPKVDQLSQALDSMNLMAGSLADLSAAVVSLVAQPRDSPRQARKGEGLTAPTVSPSIETRSAPTEQTS